MKELLKKLITGDKAAIEAIRTKARFQNDKQYQKIVDSESPVLWIDDSLGMPNSITKADFNRYFGTKKTVVIDWSN